MVDEVSRQGGYFMTPEESEKLSKFILRANGTMNPKIVGKSAQTTGRYGGHTVFLPVQEYWFQDRERG